MTVVSPTSVIRDALNTRADLALSALDARTRRSWKMNLDCGALPPRGDNLSGHPAFHLYLREGNGAYAVDFDGNCYIDLSMGLGAQLLGHGVTTVLEAVAEQAARGWHVGLASEHQLHLAHLIQSASPNHERIVFRNSSSDATAYAIRAARAFTGRDLIGVCAGLSHGANEYGMAGDAPHAVADRAVSLTYGRTSAFESIRRHRRELAAVVVEPVRTADPSFEHVEWLRELAHVCGETGALLILDERFTGFRLAYGGAQERIGLRADLVTYGDVVGGGLLLGAVAGRADVIDSIADWDLRSEHDARGNLLAIAAGAATLTHLSARRTTFYPSLDEKTHLLSENFNNYCTKRSLAVHMRYAGSIFRIHFKPPTEGDAAERGAYAAAEAGFYALLLNRGIFIHPSRLGFLSAAHNTGDVMEIVTACRDALADVQNDGLFDVKA